MKAAHAEGAKKCPRFQFAGETKKEDFRLACLSRIFLCSASSSTPYRRAFSRASLSRAMARSACSSCPCPMSFKVSIITSASASGFAILHAREINASGSEDEDDRWAWTTDEEFAREMLAGVNPLSIQRLQEFPPISLLDASKHGNQNSAMKAEHVERNMGGLSVQQALELDRLFILDHHDAVMPFLRDINSGDRKIHATRTLLLLRDDGTLKPLAIELSLPHHDDENPGARSSVFTPAGSGDLLGPAGQRRVDQRRTGGRCVGPLRSKAEADREQDCGVE